MSVTTANTFIRFNDGTTQTSAKQIAKAWVNFDNTGTVSNSFNVSSVTRNSTGNYSINYTSALNSTSYAAIVSSSSYNGGAQSWLLSDSGPNLNSGGFNTSYMSTNFIRIQGGNAQSSVPYDSYLNCVVVFDI